MKNKLIAFSDKEIQDINIEYKKLEITFTEAVRRIIDKYFSEKENDKNKKNLD